MTHPVSSPCPTPTVLEKKAPRLTYPSLPRRPFSTLMIHDSASDAELRSGRFPFASSINDQVSGCFDRLVQIEMHSAVIRNKLQELQAVAAHHFLRFSIVNGADDMF